MLEVTGGCSLLLEWKLWLLTWPPERLIAGEWWPIHCWVVVKVMAVH